MVEPPKDEGFLVLFYLDIAEKIQCQKKDEVAVGPPQLRESQNDLK
jgi:hypothetical protein